MSQPFKDPGFSTYAFMSPVLVRCPKCDACARVHCEESSNGARVTCGACGHARVTEARVLKSLGSPTDPYFGLDLWLQLPCCGETLWARNVEHLEFLADYVQAKLRERSTETQGHGLRNKLMTSRLPTWLTQANNRTRVLRCIAQLRQMA